MVTINITSPAYSRQRVYAAIGGVTSMNPLYAPFIVPTPNYTLGIISIYNALNSGLIPH
jgi:hypothetical protein